MQTTRTSRTSSLPPSTPPATTRSSRPTYGVRFRSQDDVRIVETIHDAELSEKHPTSSSQQSTSIRVGPLQSQSPLPVGNQSMMYRMGAIVFLLVLIVPLLHDTSFLGHASIPMRPVGGVVIPEHVIPGGAVLDQRQDNSGISPTAICKRWAQMSAIVNGTLYLYGGQATATESQDTDTWNNDFLSLDLTESEHRKVTLSVINVADYSRLANRHSTAHGSSSALRAS